MIAEILSVGTELLMGQIANTDAQYLSRRLGELGVALYRHTTVGDNPGRVKEALREALGRCDIVITTGGVSVGDYDFTPDAMERSGAEILIRTLFLKPGGASAYGIRDGKLICGLSGCR